MTKSPAGPRKANRATPADKTRAVAKVPNAPKAVTKPAKAANTPKTAPAARRKAKGAAEEFPIVGIGASAGGLEAIEQFLAKTPAGSGMAYVVVQHLDPSRKGMMPELLQRVTRMKVEQAADSVKVEPDHVYVIPPNMDMALQQGVLHLFEFEEPRAQRLPIDFFLRSLAADRRHLAIGVILSGMGSDGSLGLRAIKENAGLTLAQDPKSARFDGMPRSAIDTGVADIVAPADELPGRILAYLHHTPMAVLPEAQLETEVHGSLDKILILLRMQTGHDFTLYKKSTLYRRIERRMGIHQIDRILTFARFLRENPAELDLLFKELLIGVTSFFRDPEVWESLRNQALPKLFLAIPSGRVLRAWVAGCSTGEEAYSLAIVFKEALEQCRPGGRFSLQIYATDLDRSAIEKARLGHYPSNVAADISPERLSRWFISDNSGYRVGKEIREMVIFAPQNLIMDPPFTKLDVLSCRNLLIYLGPELQKKLIPLFHYSLNPGGILMLGTAETVGSYTDLFSAANAKLRLYWRSEMSVRMGEVEFPTRMFAARSGVADEIRAPEPVVNLQAVADNLVLRSYSPPAVLVNPKGDIVYINGRTGKFLEPASGRANWNILRWPRTACATSWSAR
jgi:two-component system, chemotaxis family, CheB/CheR fusion protein